MLTDIHTGGHTVLSAQAAAAFPPIRGLDVTDWVAGTKAVPQFDALFSADGTCNVTAGEMLYATSESQVIADDNVDTVDFANNELDLAGHLYQTGDGPLRLTTTDTLPTGLALATDYYAIKKDAGTIQLATSRANALAGTAVTFSDVGVGTHTIADTADTTRLIWATRGLNGQAADGAIALTATKWFLERFDFNPRIVAISFTGTLSANNLTVKAFPVAEG